METHYLNTDLELEAPFDLTALVRVLEAHDFLTLDIRRQESGEWRATLETSEQFEEPEVNIAAILAVVEGLPEAARNEWKGCRTREFDIGYECGTKPYPFSQTLSSVTLQRLVLADATLRVSIYPARSQDVPGPTPATG